MSRLRETIGFHWRCVIDVVTRAVQSQVTFDRGARVVSRWIDV